MEGNRAGPGAGLPRVWWEVLRTQRTRRVRALRRRAEWANQARTAPTLHHSVLCPVRKDGWRW